MTSSATKTKTVLKNVDKVTIGSEQCITETLGEGQMVVLPKGTEVVSAWKDSSGALSLQLSNGGMLVIKNYAALAADHAVVLGANGQAINLDKYLAIGEEMQMAAVNPEAGTLCGLQMGNTDPVRVAIAEMQEIKIPAPVQHVAAKPAPAAEVIDIEPAAGGNPGASGGGFGFQSAYASTPLNGFDDVGGLGGTDLQYAANFQSPLGNILGFPNLAATPAPFVPTMSVTGATALEDSAGSPVSIDISSTMTNHETVITITGIDSKWTVDTSTSGGTYDAATGTWTTTVPAGGTFNGSPTFVPPHNSDVDMTVNVNSTVREVGTGNVVSSINEDATIVLDAVADLAAIQLTQKYYSPYYGNYQMGLQIAAQVTDTDGSEIITKIVIDLSKIQTIAFADGHGVPNGLSQDMSFASLGATLNKGVEVSPGVWEITVNDMDAAAALNGLAINMPTYVGNLWHAFLKFDIPVSVHTHEEFLNGGETNYTNNDAVTTSSFNVEIYWSPLVLDLDGNGQIDLVGKDAGVMFDMTNDGLADKTTWVKATDGLLALDLNGDGIINNQNELFGDSQTARDGFADLAQHDSNGDGKIDSNDQVYSKLLVWQDLNQDGISQANEMHSLEDLGIASINLASKVVNQANADGAVWLEGSFTYEDGRVGNVSDVLFNVDAAANDQGMVLQGTAGKETFMGTAQSDVIIGMGGNDIAFGGAGADRFVASSNGVMKIMDFNLSQGDTLDLGNVLSNINANDPISKYVQVVQNGAHTEVQVDATGTGHFTTLAVLNNVHASLEDLVSHGSLVVGHGGNPVSHVGGTILDIADVLSGDDALAGVFGHAAGVAAPAGSAAPLMFDPVHIEVPVAQAA